jgi:dTDP-4-amino-4,6-dideoxygalactose transaminase
MFYVVLPDRSTRDGLLEYLNALGIYAVFHYVPLHSSPMGRTFGSLDLPETDSASARLLRLPFYYEFSEAEQSRVVQAIRKFFADNASRVGDIRAGIGAKGTIELVQASER